LLHLPAQGRHLGNGETGIVSNHDRLGVFEDAVQGRDLLLLFRSVHCLSPVGSGTSAAGFTLPARIHRLNANGGGSALD
jgi:hypothetical protein